MEQNQTVDNDLQKAIDDITNTTNIDPVFSDPVAAPSSVPEDDTGELGAAVGPFPAPAPKVEALAPAPEPIAPLQSMDIPELTMPDLEPAPAPMPAPDSIMPPAPESAPEPELPPKPEAGNLNMHQIKDLNDYTVLEPAYKTAKNIADETKRAEALLYLIESIDKM